MESLVIEVYVHRKRHVEIQSGGTFVRLEKLISHICADATVSLSRDTPKTMHEVKDLGDAAAHDRVYITQQVDIDGVASRFRRLVNELSVLAGVRS